MGKISVRVPAAIGVTVKSGWASVVLVAGTTTAPRVVDSRRIDLSDPAEADARQPYHAGFGTARGSGAELTRLVDGVKRFGRRSVADTIKGYRSSGHELRGVGIVVGSLVDPTTIGNDHIRIHALEGQLFRSVVEDAAHEGDLACSIWRERDLYGAAAAALQRREDDLRATVAAFRRKGDGTWRAEQKAATVAAWLMLAGPPELR